MFIANKQIMANSFFAFCSQTLIYYVSLLDFFSVYVCMCAFFVSVSLDVIQNLQSGTDEYFLNYFKK